MMVQPVCVPCKRTMRCEKNEFRIVKMCPPSYRDWNGLDLEPYQIWSGDKWKCHGCGTEVVVGWARKPSSEAHEERFQKELDAYKPLEITDP